nr:hypothetical protein [Tanacetum cinerariifolium]
MGKYLRNKKKPSKTYKISYDGEGPSLTINRLKTQEELTREEMEEELFERIMLLNEKRLNALASKASNLNPCGIVISIGQGKKGATLVEFSGEVQDNEAEDTLLDSEPTHEEILGKNGVEDEFESMDDVYSKLVDCKKSKKMKKS